MAVYVDRMRRKALGKTFTAHMVADSTEELDAMAANLGLKAAWRQKTGTPMEHYDLVESKRQLAVMLGAIEVTTREMGRILTARRGAA